jgi:PadR family transcriptional regulator PadR
MAKNDLQGALDLLVLKTLSQLGSMHGYGILTHIRRVSGELLIVEEGSLYPALHRMEQNGWVRASWAVTDYGRKAKWYALTRAGREQLASREKNWAQVVKGVDAVLRFASGERWHFCEGWCGWDGGRAWSMRLTRSCGNTWPCQWTTAWRMG